MLKFAIPNKGRLYEPTLKILKESGIKIIDAGSRKLFGKTSDGNIKILFVRAQDIPRYVEAGAADVGITGYDLVEESGADVKLLTELNYGCCSIVLAVPESSPITSLSQIKGKTIATTLPNLSKRYFKRKKIPVKIIRVSGATEIIPYIGIADGIVDIVSTGTTLAMNKLRILDIILESAAYFIANKKSLKEKGKAELIDEINLSFKSVLSAEKKKYIMLNATSEAILKKVINLIPCMESPTILKLAKKGEYAVHAVIDEEEISNTIRKLKKVGGKDILVLSIERVVH